jgi:hypothetical protein
MTCEPHLTFVGNCGIQNYLKGDETMATTVMSDPDIKRNVVWQAPRVTQIDNRITVSAAV